MDEYKKKHLLFFALFFVFLWQIIAYLHPSYISISALFFRIWEYKELFSFHVWATLKELFIAFTLSIPLSFILAILFFSFRGLKLVFDPIFILFQTLPSFIIAPIFILFFGWSMISILVPIVLLITFPLTSSIYKGLISTPNEIVSYFAFCGVSKKNLLLQIRLPYATPYFFSGLRIAASSSVSYAVSGEFVGAQEGLGVLIQLFRRQFDFLSLASAILILLSLSLIFYLIALLFENLFSSLILYGSIKKNSSGNTSSNISWMHES